MHEHRCFLEGGQWEQIIPQRYQDCLLAVKLDLEEARQALPEISDNYTADIILIEGGPEQKRSGACVVIRSPSGESKIAGFGCAGFPRLWNIYKEYVELKRSVSGARCSSPISSSIVPPAANSVAAPPSPSQALLPLSPVSLKSLVSPPKATPSALTSPVWVKKIKSSSGSPKKSGDEQPAKRSSVSSGTDSSSSSSSASPSASPEKEVFTVGFKGDRWPSITNQHMPDFKAAFLSDISSCLPIDACVAIENVVPKDGGIVVISSVPLSQGMAQCLPKVRNCPFKETWNLYTRLTSENPGLPKLVGPSPSIRTVYQYPPTISTSSTVPVAPPSPLKSSPPPLQRFSVGFPGEFWSQILPAYYPPLLNVFTRDILDVFPTVAPEDVRVQQYRLTPEGAVIDFFIVRDPSRGLPLDIKMHLREAKFWRVWDLYGQHHQPPSSQPLWVSSPSAYHPGGMTMTPPPAPTMYRQGPLLDTYPYSPAAMTPPPPFPSSAWPPPASPYPSSNPPFPTMPDRYRSPSRSSIRSPSKPEPKNQYTPPTRKSNPRYTASTLPTRRTTGYLPDPKDLYDEMDAPESYPRNRTTSLPSRSSYSPRKLPAVRTSGPDAWKSRDPMPPISPRTTPPATHREGECDCEGCRRVAHLKSTTKVDHSWERPTSCYLGHQLNSAKDKLLLKRYGSLEKGKNRYYR